MTTKPKCCPECGQPIAPDVELSPILSRIYEFVRRHPRCTRDQIIDHVYADDPNGGPESRHTIAVHIYRLNRVLRPYGIVVRATKGHGANYSIHGHSMWDEMWRKPFTGEPLS
jgi:DNA-binding response OmpR family regulator